MSILKKLMPDHQGVVYFEIAADKKSIRVIEGCDSYFYEDLTKVEFGQLIVELQSLREQMVDSPSTHEERK